VRSADPPERAKGEGEGGGHYDEPAESDAGAGREVAAAAAGAVAGATTGEMGGRALSLTSDDNHLCCSALSSTMTSGLLDMRDGFSRALVTGLVGSTSDRPDGTSGRHTGRGTLSASPPAQREAHTHAIDISKLEASERAQCSATHVTISGGGGGLVGRRMRSGGHAEAVERGASRFGQRGTAAAQRRGSGLCSRSREEGQRRHDRDTGSGRGGREREEGREGL
jgi:hypothetical protein